MAGDLNHLHSTPQVCRAPYEHVSHYTCHFGWIEKSQPGAALFSIFYFRVEKGLVRFVFSLVACVQVHGTGLRSDGARR